MKQTFGRQAVDPETLLNLVTQYKALRIRQLLLLFPGREEIVQRLLTQLHNNGRLVLNRGKGIIACSEEWARDGNLPCEMAFWVLLDFHSRVEFHLPGANGVTITAYTENGEYDLIVVLPGKEAVISAMIRAQSESLSDKQVVILQTAEQIPKLCIEDVTACCVVSEDGQTTYYTPPKPQRRKDDTTTIQPAPE